ncbi:MAG: GIY-YIG nuclease family protein [Rhodospirillaceae bacterium]|nr:GIY-YIG nuclease family protein [Rhodospirillaceae bacterium]
MTEKVRGAVYYNCILASQPHGTPYIGVTNDLARRVHEHRTDAVDGFTKRYGVHRLVYFEATENVEAAIVREKRLKMRPRSWKADLIARDNPAREDLFSSIVQ